LSVHSGSPFGILIQRCCHFLEVASTLFLVFPPGWYKIGSEALRNRQRPASFGSGFTFYTDLAVPEVMRIPTQPATYSDLNPATLSDAAPVDLWARQPSPIAAIIQCRSALSTSPQAGRGLPRRGGRLLIGIGGRNKSEFAR
jgi:hypothetical protein